MTPSKKIDTAILDVLKAGTILENRYCLPAARLDRKAYEQVNEVLTRLGGKWKSGKIKAHVFEDVDPAPLLALVLETGEMPPKNPTAFFPTPSEVIERLLTDHAFHQLPAFARRVLEPSAGKGNIAEALTTYYPQEVIECCEMLPAFRSFLARKGFNLVDETDFLAYEPGPVYDLIAMNPPFTSENDSLAYVAHVEHAWSLLAPGGILRAIVPGGFAFRQEKRVKTFRELVETHGTWQALEEGAFAESGTGVRTLLLSMKKASTQ